MRLAYGAVQRRDTLDHVIGRLAGRPPRGSTRRCSTRCGSACSSSASSTGCAARRGRASPSSWSRAGGPGGWSTPCCGARPARRPRSSRRFPTHAAEGRRCATRIPTWLARLWWEALGAGARPLADGRGQQAGRDGASASTRSWPTPSERARPSWARTPGGGRARGRWCSTRRSTSPARGLSRGARHAAVTRLDARGARRWARGPASACSTCARRPGGKATHLAALMGRAVRSSPWSATPGGPRAAARDVRAACTPKRAAWSEGDARDDHGRRASTASSWTRRAPAWGRCAGGPTCAGARRPRRRRARRAPARDPPAAARAVRAGRRRSSTPPARSPGGERGRRGRAAGRRRDFVAEDLQSDGPLWKHPDCGRRTFCCCRTGTARTASSSRACGGEAMSETESGRPRTGLSRVRRALAAAHEPSRPLPLRVLPAPLRAGLAVPGLRRALDDRADVEHGRPQVQPLRRQHAEADLMDRS